jgi:hypothetical protein
MSPTVRGLANVVIFLKQDANAAQSVDRSAEVPSMVDEWVRETAIKG